MTLQQEACVQLPAEGILWEIVESVTDAVVTIDEDHRVLMCNKAAEEMFGYKRSEIIGHDVSPLIPNPHQAVHREYVERYLDSGVPRVMGKVRECSVQHRDGRSFPVEISYSVSRTGGRLYFTAVLRDISARKEMEREMRFMERLADVGKSIAHVVHEIRKPLVLIGGFARQVERAEALKDCNKDRHKLRIIAEEIRRLEALLNGIRLLTRPATASRKRDVSINSLLRESFELIEPLLQAQRVQLDADLDQNPLMVCGDQDQLKQVFLNLLQNALEAMNGTGAVRAVSELHGANARVIIQDSGPGIPKDIRDKIFDPFFTTKSEGTGLGLAVSKHIIQDHGGALTVDDRLASQGATFIVELPLSQAGY